MSGDHKSDSMSTGGKVGVAIVVLAILMIVTGYGALWFAIVLLLAGLLTFGIAEVDEPQQSTASKRSRVSYSPSPKQAPASRQRFADDWLDVVGESFFEPANRSYMPGETGIHEATGSLVREPNNKADANAVGVHVVGAGQVGYLTRDDAADVAASIDDLGGRVECGIRHARNAADRYWSFTVVTDLELLE